MIVTVTLNPAVDEEYVIPRYESGRWIRSSSSQRTPGGSGINVALILNQLGFETAAMGFLAGFNGDYIRDALRRYGITTNFIHVPGETRTNINVVDEAHQCETSIVEGGHPVSSEAVARFMTNYRRMMSRASAVVLGGSLPQDVSGDIYGEMTRIAVDAGLPVYVDASGAELSAALEGDPFYVNVDHRFLLGEQAQTSVEPQDARAALVDHLKNYGARWAVASCDVCGEIFSTPSGIYLAKADRDIARSLFTFDDAITAGVVVATLENMPVEDVVKFSLACALEDSSHALKGVSSREAVERFLPSVSIERLD